MPNAGVASQRPLWDLAPRLLVTASSEGTGDRAAGPELLGFHNMEELPAAKLARIAWSSYCDA